jgi:hypothetical protein
MLQVPGVAGLISELTYHRYVGVSDAALQAIGARVQRDGVKSSMLEHIGSGFDDLYQDLTVANVSAWEQFTLAFCGNRDNLDNNGVYYQINQTNPSSPKVNITNHAKLLRQVFAYVRAGAVRIGATSGGRACANAWAPGVRILRAFAQSGLDEVLFARCTDVRLVELPNLCHRSRQEFRKVRPRGGTDNVQSAAHKLSLVHTKGFNGLAEHSIRARSDV